MSLIRGDCANVMAGMPKDTVDLIVTSPPYDSMRDYKGYSFDFDAVAAGMMRVLKKDGGVAVWVVGDQTHGGGRTLTSFRQAVAFQDMGFVIHDVIIWDKHSVPFQHKTRYANVYEHMIVLVRGGPAPRVFNPLKRPNTRAGGASYHSKRRRDGNYDVRKPFKVHAESNRFNIWRYDVGYMKVTKDKIAHEHPAIFPDELAADCIRSWSNPGDLVLDPFVGSGTTAKMAEMLGRRWIGIDVSAEYLDIARRRIESVRAQCRLDAC